MLPVNFTCASLERRNTCFAGNIFLIFNTEFALSDSVFAMHVEYCQNELLRLMP